MDSARATLHRHLTACAIDDEVVRTPAHGKRGVRAAATPHNRGCRRQLDRRFGERYSVGACPAGERERFGCSAKGLLENADEGVPIDQARPRGCW